jgi:hypothetical protein
MAASVRGGGRFGVIFHRPSSIARISDEAPLRIGPAYELDASVQGWINHVRFADTWGLREHIFASHPMPPHRRPLV